MSPDDITVIPNLAQIKYILPPSAILLRYAVTATVASVPGLTGLIGLVCVVTVCSASRLLDTIVTRRKSGYFNNKTRGEKC